MSVKWMARVWPLEIPATPKLVLLSLADQANEGGTCWPSQPQIAKRCSITDRAVRVQIQFLEETGMLARKVKPGIGTTFILNVPDAEPRNDVPPRNIIPPRNEVPPTPESGSGDPGTTFRQTVSNRQQPSVVGDKPPIVGKAADPCPHQAIIELYHQTLPTGRQVRIWNDTRKAKLRSRWKEDPKRQNLAWWGKFFGYIAESDFLTGKTASAGRPPFELDLEWIVSPTNFVKIIEGKYHREVAA